MTYDEARTLEGIEKTETQLLSISKCAVTSLNFFWGRPSWSPRNRLVT